MLPERIKLETAARKNPFIKKSEDITYAKRELNDWLKEHIDPSDLSEKYLVVLQTTHTHIHFSDNVSREVLSESKKSSDFEKLKKEFNERADRWEKQTGFHSSPVIRFMHNDYQSIMAKGKEVIPHILYRIKRKPDDWFWALRHIANFDAAVASGATNFDEAVAAWLKWGVDENYISE
jgi:hypothetical protein